jgi:hypothetical protein
MVIMPIQIPYTITPTIETQKYWEGMGRQNLKFHQAVCELIDNSISASGKDRDGDLLPFKILIWVKIFDNYIEVIVGDDGFGISGDEFAEKILQCGGQGNIQGPLNEHGFGLKHALCTLTDNNRLGFEIRSRDRILAEDVENQNNCYIVRGPFKDNLILDYDNIENWKVGFEDHFICETGTRVSFKTTYEYFKTLYSRKVINLDTLMPRLGEHLGVTYRGYLRNLNHKMWLKWEFEGGRPREERISAIEVPYTQKRSFNFEFEKEGVRAKAVYTWGECDKNIAKDENRGWVYPLQIYYQHNIPSSGIDIMVRNRVLTTCEIETIFESINRGPSYNWLVGELELDQNFRTTNNKTTLDNNNFFWQRLIAKLNYLDENGVKPYVPKANADILSEEELQKTIAANLEGYIRGSKSSRNYPIFSGCGVKADIYLKLANNDVELFEVKKGTVGPLDVYQLLMYWDGYVFDNGGNPPKSGVLVGKDAPDSVNNMIRIINENEDFSGNNYKIEFKKLDSFGISNV